MMTRHLSISPPALPVIAPVAIANLKLEVVTPMFGGGATAGYSDDDWPIRPAAIRGQLRFWWRACNARRFASVAAMRAEEARIWGSARNEANPQTGPGMIDLSVTVTGSGPANALANCPSVAVFPFKETHGNNPLPDRPGRSGISFTLRLSLAHGHAAHQHDAKTAAEQALWAWIMFGGVGARTRRGCGSLKCTGNAGEAGLLDASCFQPPAQNTMEWLQQQASCLIDVNSALTPPNDLKLVPVLHGATLIAGTVRAGASTAWQNAVEPLRQFRQESDIGRNPGAGPQHPGQSRWPEPGAIRRLFNQPRPGYAIVPAGTPPSSLFPRADLGGLPIVFQMERHPGGQGAYSATLQLVNEKRARMASPLIVKPLALAGNNQCIALTLLLNAPHLWDAGVPELKFRDTNHHFPAQPMTALPAWPWPNQPPNVAGKTSARDAYLDFIDDPANPTRITL